MKMVFLKLTSARKAEVVRLLGDVAEGDDGSTLHQRKLELELRFTADDSGVEGQDLGPV